MIKNVQRKYFEIWGTEEAQNIVLKYFTLYLCLIITAMTIALTIISNRKPLLVAVSSTESRVFRITPPKDELLRAELERTVSQYVTTHYTWDYTSIEAAHKAAANYVSETFQKSFLKANQDQVKFVKEKRVSQKVYVAAPTQIDTKALAARVRLDRIYAIDGMSGASPITLDLRFEYGDRTEKNPEGIYIIDEKLVTEGGGQ